MEEAGGGCFERQKYQEVPELKEAMELLETGKFKKLVAFSYSAKGKKVH